MFDFAWSEIALIGVVALVLIGPKDLPIAIKGVATMVKRARKMAAEFQTHVDDLAREANLHEVRQQINEIRNFDIRGEVEKAVDADGSIRKTFADNPLVNPLMPTPASVASSTAAIGDNLHPPTPAVSGPADLGPSSEAAPAFIPPELTPVPPAPAAVSSEPPAFIPPGVKRT